MAAPLDYSRAEVRGRYRPFVKTAERQIEWKSEPVAAILRKVRSGDGAPGVLDDIGGLPDINAMNDFVLSLLTATDHLTIAALYGSAGAGGVMMALGADRVLAREGIVLSPHYKGMGGLYGSEYWTYSLPKRVGIDRAEQLTEQCLPISVHEAKAIGLIDDSKRLSANRCALASCGWAADRPAA